MNMALETSLSVSTVLPISLVYEWVTLPPHYLCTFFLTTPQNTHVVELYSRLEKNDQQLTYYDSGIGTFVAHSNWIGWIIQLIVHIWDMMVAWYVHHDTTADLAPQNLKEIIKELEKNCVSGVPLALREL